MTTIWNTGSQIANGRYRIERVLGEGGMGVVYEATELTLDRKVALKVLLSELSQHSTARQRMEAEAKALARLNSPHVVRVHTVFDEAGLLVMDLEYMAGGALADRLTGEGVDEAQCCEWMTQVLAGLEALHNAGMVHRDLKPGNVLLDLDGNLKVTDLGIAQDSQRSGLFKTRADANLGTPEYMAPEQIQSAATVDARADLYAAGVMLYELLTGRVPFGGEEWQVKTAQVQQAPDLAPVRAKSPTLAKVVERALAKDPQQRFATAREFREALRAPAAAPARVATAPAAQRALVEPEPMYAQPAPVALSGSGNKLVLLAGLVIVVGAFVFAATRSQQDPDAPPAAAADEVPEPSAEAPAAPAAETDSDTPVAAPPAVSRRAGPMALTGAIHAIGSKVTGQHDINFKEFTGYFAAKDGKAEGGAIGFEVKVASLEEVVKERNEWVEKFEGHMKSPDFFDVEKFPTATFVSTEIKAGGHPAAAGSTHTIKGNLTLRGVTKVTTFPATIAINGEDVTGTAEFSINRKDFGIVYAGQADDLIRDGVVLKLALKGSTRLQGTPPTSRALPAPTKLPPIGAVLADPPAAPAPEADPVVAPTSRVQDAFQSWVEAQNNGNFLAYQDLYDDEFRGIRRTSKAVAFDRAGWLADRKSMFRKGQQVAASDTIVTMTGEATARIDFTQTWTNGRYSDKGPKVLNWVWRPSGWRITYEELKKSTKLNHNPFAE
jgi:polyisoprenoid-binding protein YceI